MGACAGGGGAWPSRPPTLAPAPSSMYMVLFQQGGFMEYRNIRQCHNGYSLNIDKLVFHQGMFKFYQNIKHSLKFFHIGPFDVVSFDSGSYSMFSLLTFRPSMFSCSMFSCLTFSRWIKNPSVACRLLSDKPFHRCQALGTRLEKIDPTMTCRIILERNLP